MSASDVARPPVSASDAGPAARVGAAARVLLALVGGYRRWVSPLLGPHCRFAPTCSAYAAQALAEHGAWRGSWLAASRIGRCHPFHPGGVDPVPLPRARRRTASPPTRPSPAPSPGRASGPRAATMGGTAGGTGQPAGPEPAPAHARPRSSRC